MSPVDGDGVDRDRWNAVHARGGSALLTEIRRHTLTDALPAEVDATTIWPAWPLEVVGDALALRPGETLADIACGMGDIGRWIARRAKAIVVGVDPSTAALSRARERAAGARATYSEGHFEATGLSDASVDAVLVVDALQFASDEAATLRELARILRPGRRLVVVGPEPPGRTWSVDELRVVSRTETDDWRARIESFGELLRARRDDLVRDFGEKEADELIARPASQVATTQWHGMVVAERR